MAYLCFSRILQKYIACLSPGIYILEKMSSISLCDFNFYHNLPHMNLTIFSVNCIKILPQGIYLKIQLLNDNYCSLLIQTYHMLCHSQLVRISQYDLTMMFTDLCSTFLKSQHVAFFISSWNYDCSSRCGLRCFL